MSAGDRAFAWLITGPLGRVAAFFADLAAYWWRWLRGRLVARHDELRR